MSLWAPSRKRSRTRDQLVTIHLHFVSGGSCVARALDELDWRPIFTWFWETDTLLADLVLARTVAPAQPFAEVLGL